MVIQKIKIKRSMKKLFKITIFILFLTCVDDSAHGPYGSDNTPPGVVEINEVVNTPGGAIIYFTPPNDEDLLYVKASFMDENQIDREVIVSSVIDSLNIVGFAEEGNYPVNVFAVDRGVFLLNQDIRQNSTLIDPLTRETGQSLFSVIPASPPPVRSGVRGTRGLD